MLSSDRTLQFIQFRRPNNLVTYIWGIFFLMNATKQGLKDFKNYLKIKTNI